MDPVKFLLVDDLDENLLSLEALLHRDGLILLKAHSGDEALELLLQNDVALALIDVQMPGLNGFELAELMRGNGRSRGVPIIFVTAGSAEHQRRFLGYEAGAVDFIQKPIEPDILRSKAKVFLELYRQRQQISAQRDALSVQAAALKDADRRKDEFLATLAHELRNPLAPFRNGLDILRKKPDAERAAEIRDMMDRQLGHMVRLIDDLLDVSRVSEGKIELRKKTINLGNVVRVAVEASRPVIDASGHKLTVGLPTNAIWLDADDTRLSQIIANLLNNAAKYTPAKGVIALSVREEGADVVIDVSDNGLGIPREKQAEIFQLFAQVDGHLERAQGGLGIGLALVKQLVTLHGGTVEVMSDGAGKGSLFRIRLPTAASPILNQPGDAISLPLQKSLKVLVIDDHHDFAYSLGLMLKEMGHNFHLLHDGRDVLREAKEYRPDAILLDIGLPRMDGYDVCRMLRADAMFNAVPIIAQTGWGQSSDKDKASEAGFSRHLTKPVGLDALRQVLQDLAK